MSEIENPREHAITRALTYTNSSVVCRYAMRLGLSNSEAQVHWQELMKFLTVCAASDDAYCPSRELDQIWHEFLLHTRDYDEFCTEVLGVFVHHEPTDVAEPERYRETLRAMERHFGPLKEALWPHLAEEGADCKGKNCRGCKSCRHHTVEERASSGSMIKA